MVAWVWGGKNKKNGSNIFLIQREVLGRKPKINPELKEKIRFELGRGKNKAVVAKELNVSRFTIYRALDQICNEIDNVRT